MCKMYFCETWHSEFSGSREKFFLVLLTDDLLHPGAYLPLSNGSWWYIFFKKRCPGKEPVHLPSISFGWAPRTRIACSRLSDSGEEAKAKGPRKVGGAGKKGKRKGERACDHFFCDPLPPTFGTLKIIRFWLWAQLLEVWLALTSV